jgi:SHS2 domain-containing protein
MEHTADTGIIVRAPALAELFARAAWGMFSVITDPATVQPRQEFSCALEADDLAMLLVRWLSELNFHHITRHEVYSRFAVSLVGETRLQAVVGGEAIEPGRHLVHTEIKAVTYHELRVEKHGDLWLAQVLFDL